MNALPGSVRPPNRIVAALVALVLTINGCKSNKESAEAPPAAQGGAATAAITQTSWAPDALEELVAPIALYPDQLVGQILAASVSSQEVLDAGNWLIDHQDLKGDALTAAAKEADFGPAMQALVQFPTVVDMMCQELDWTKQLGAAFTSDQKGVLDAIQRLRTSALNVGNLKTGPQQTVETTVDNGKSVVEIKPTNPKVVYVPQYDPAVVYTSPPATSTTTVIQEDNNGSAAAGALLGFGIGIMVGAAINNSYCYPHYGYGAVYMGPRPFYPPAYAYRPVYPAYRPAYGYHPPGGYGNNYHRGNTNIQINNNFNRFENNANLKGGARSPLNDRGRDNAGVSDRSRAGNKAGVSDRAGTSNRAGSSSGYKGAKPGGSKQVRDSQARVAASNGTRKTAAATDRGYGGSNRASAGTADRAGASRTASASQRPSASSRASAGGGSARVASGAGGTRVESGGGANVIRSSGSAGASSRSSSSAFSGASRSGGGSFDRAASARGNASTSSSSARRASGGGGSRGGGGRR